MTSQSLLQRWTHKRDPEAFRELVTRYAPMLFATSKRILGNDFEAEEITQECFELLAEGSRRPKRHVGSWLHAVATNRCLDRIRSSRRRVRRERAFAEREEKTTDINTHSDLYEHIDAAVAALPERFRVPVVAHFLEGRSHQDIANELSVSRQTVTHRIGMGVERVRVTLHRRGVRTSVTLLGTFFQEQATARVDVSPTLNATLGKLAVAGPVTIGGAGTGLLGISPTPSAFIGAGVIISLLVGGAFLVIDGRKNGELQSPEMVVSQVEPETFGADSEAVDSGASSRGEARQYFVASTINPDEAGNSPIQVADEETTNLDSRNGASVSGVVLLPTGLPYIEAIVNIAPVGTEYKYPNVATCDTQGSFYVEELREGTYSIQVMPPGTRTSGKPYELLQITLARDEQRTGIEIVYGLEGNLRISGRVVDTSGNPIHGARVDTYGPVQRLAVTNKVGEFAIDYLPPGQYKLSADKHQTHTGTGLFAEAGDENVEIVLKGLGTLEGVVVNARTGRPVKEYEVSYMNGHAVEFRESLFGNAKVFDNRDGTFHFEKVYVGDLTILARAEGHSSELVHVKLEEHTTLSDIVVRLHASQNLTGRVVDAEGNPVIGAALDIGEVQDSYMWNRIFASAPLTDEEGRFTVPDVPPNSQIISAYHSDYATGSALIADDVEIVLYKAAQLTVSVSKGGVPVERAEVRVYLSPEARANYIAGGVTEPDGSLDVKDLHPGYVRVWSRLQDSRALEKDLLLEPGAQHRVDFDFGPADAALEGRVTYQAFPIEHLMVHAYVNTPNGLEHHEMIGRADGTFRFDHLPEGSGMLLFGIYGKNTMRRHLVRDVALYSGETVFEDFLFEGSGAVSGNVRETLPDYDTQILVLAGDLGWDEALESLKLGPFGMYTAALGVADSDQAFEINYLEPGEYTLIVGRRPLGDRANLEYIDIARVRVRKGETVTVDFAQP